LLCAVALGVVAMHHVGTVEAAHPVAGEGPAMAMLRVDAAPVIADPLEGEHGTHHENHFLHLCLAVLCTVLGLGLIRWLLLARWSAVSALVPPRGEYRIARAPPLRPGGDILLRSCVLRL
jgi:hypothetical protein